MMEESESLEMLKGLMGEGYDEEIARRVLNKFNGDLQQAASAILEGDTGETSHSVWQVNSNNNAMNYNLQASGSGSGALNAPLRTNTPCPPEEPRKEKEVIDLTSDYDSELSQALAMSLETENQPQPVFRSSSRAPDPNWAMVPSNVPQGTTLTTAQTQEDQSLSRAIEASLTASFFEDKFEELPPEDRIRQADSPMALRTTMTEFYFAPLVLQVLFHVPQVREKLSRYQLRDDYGQLTDVLTPGINDGDYIVSSLCCFFAHMDLGIRSEMRVDQILMDVSRVYKGKRANSASESPGDLSDDFYTYIVKLIEEQIQIQKNGKLPSGQWDRLFHLRYAPTNTPLPSEDAVPNALGLDAPLLMSALDIACVKVDVRGNNLISCLSAQLGLELKEDLANVPGLTSHSQSLIAPSEIVAFHLVRQASGSQSNSSLFRYPKHVYLDQFLRENAESSSEKRTLRKELQKELKELTDKKNGLMQFNGKDTIKALTSSLYYFENVASREGTPTRAEEVKNAAKDLRKILTQVENEIQALDTQISRLQTLCERVFDDPDLKKHRYDLRGVLVHDGLFGRNHIYSFVEYNGKWWKTQDAAVVEVSEELALTDTTGLHLGAGPYMLVYSRATKDPGELDWPQHFKEICEIENQEFIDRVDDTAPDKAYYLRASYKSVNIPGLSLRTRTESFGTSDASVGSTSTEKPPSRSLSVESSRGGTSSPGAEVDNCGSSERMQVE